MLLNLPQIPGQRRLKSHPVWSFLKKIGLPHERRVTDIKTHPFPSDNMCPSLKFRVTIKLSTLFLSEKIKTVIRHTNNYMYKTCVVLSSIVSHLHVSYYCYNGIFLFMHFARAKHFLASYMVEHTCLYYDLV